MRLAVIREAGGQPPRQADALVDGLDWGGRLRYSVWEWGMLLGSMEIVDNKHVIIISCPLSPPLVSYAGSIVFRCHGPERQMHCGVSCEGANQALHEIDIAIVSGPVVASLSDRYAGSTAAQYGSRGLQPANPTCQSRQTVGSGCGVSRKRRAHNAP